MNLITRLRSLAYRVRYKEFLKIDFPACALFCRPQNANYWCLYRKVSEKLGDKAHAE